MTVGVTIEMSMSPLPIVLATDVPKTANAIKLNVAAQITAWRGVRTRVETMVAIEFAASCIPFVKSKISAINIMNTIKIIVF
jgi:hypothetical protein